MIKFLVMELSIVLAATYEQRKLGVIPFPATADKSKLSIPESEYFALAHFASHCNIHSWTIARNWCYGDRLTRVTPHVLLSFDPVGFSSIAYHCHNGTITDPCTGSLIDRGNDAEAEAQNLIGFDTGSWHGVRCSETSSITGKKKVLELILPYNNVSCTMDHDLSSLVHLKKLYLSENRIFGDLPPWLGNLSNLMDLDIADNELHGTIPNEVRGLDSLRTFDLSKNKLSGPLPVDFHHMQYLYTLTLNNNLLDGQLPTSLSTMTKLQYITLRNNAFHGPLPEFNNFKLLKSMDFSNNYLSGQIPNSIGSATFLQRLILRNNSLNGTLPDIKELTDLEYLDVGDNMLTGSIPELPSKLGQPGSRVILSGPNQRFSCPFPRKASLNPAFEKINCTCMENSFCPTNNSARNPSGRPGDTQCEYDCKSCPNGKVSSSFFASGCTTPAPTPAPTKFPTPAPNQFRTPAPTPFQIGSEIVVAETELVGFTVISFNINAQEAYAQAVAQQLGLQSKKYIALFNIREKKLRRLYATRRLGVAPTVQFETQILASNDAVATTLKSQMQGLKFVASLLEEFKIELTKNKISVPQNVTLHVSNAYITLLTAAPTPAPAEESSTNDIGTYAGVSFVGLFFVAILVRRR